MPNVVEVIIKGIDQATKPLSAPLKSLEDLSKAVAKLGPIMAGTMAGVAAAFAGLTAHAINVADETGKAAQKAGTTAENFSAMGFAAKFSQVNTEQLGGSLKFLSKTMVDLAENGPNVNNGLSRLGIAAVDSTGHFRDTHAVALDVAESFKSMEDGALKTDLALKIFGKTGESLIPFLNQGKDGISALEDKARSLGLVISTETALQAERFNDSLTMIKEAGAGLAQQVATAILPNLSKLAESLAANTTQGDAQKKSAEGIAFALKLVATAALATYSVLQVLAQVIGAVLVIAFDLATEGARTLARVFEAVRAGVVGLAHSVIDSVKSLGGFADVVAKLAKGDFKSAWTAAQSTVTDFTGNVLAAGVQVIDSMEGVGSAVKSGTKNAFNNAVAVSKAAFEEMQNHGENFVTRYEALWGKANEAMQGGEKSKGAPTINTKAVDEFEAKHSAALIRAQALEAHFRADQLKGSQQLIAQVNAEYAERSAKIGQLALDEDEAISLSNELNAAHQAKLNELAQSGALFRADTEEAFKTGQINRMTELYNTQAALDAVALDGRRQFMQTYQQLWMDAHRSMFSYAAEGAKTISSGLGTALTSVITGAQSASKAFSELGKNILNMMLNWIVQRTIAFALEKAFSAAGKGILGRRRQRRFQSELSA